MAPEPTQTTHAMQPPATRKHLRRIGHQLSPVVTVRDAGVSEGVVAEAERALNDHELIKIKVACGGRQARGEAIAALCGECSAELIQRIGNMALLFRPTAQPDPRKSNLLRAET